MADGIEFDKSLILSALTFKEKYVAQLRTEIAKGVDIKTLSSIKKLEIMGALSLKGLIGHDEDFEIIRNCSEEINKLNLQE